MRSTGLVFTSFSPIDSCSILACVSFRKSSVFSTSLFRNCRVEFLRLMITILNSLQFRLCFPNISNNFFLFLNPKMLKKMPLKFSLLLSGRKTRSSFTACPQSVDSTTLENVDDHKSSCFLLVEQLIGRGLFSLAQLVFQRIIMSERLSVSKVLSAFNFSVIRGLKLDSSSYAVVIRSLVESGAYKEAEMMFKDGILSCGDFKADHSLLNSMVICYCRLGRAEEAKPLFDMLIESKLTPCKGACNQIIGSLCAKNRFLDAFDCFVGINYTGIFPPIWSYNMMIDGLCLGGYLDEALCVFDIMCDRGVPPTIHLFKRLIFGHCQRARVHEAELLSAEFECLGFILDKVLYTAIIHGYCKKKKMKTALRVFFRMLKMSCEPDSFTYNTLIHGFVNLGLFDKAWMLHDMMVRFGLEPDAVTYHIMINKYIKDYGVDSALTLLDYITNYRNFSPSIYFYTVIITALLEQKRLLEVEKWLIKMLEHRVTPDDVLFLTLINKHKKENELRFALFFLQAIAMNECQIECSSFSTSVASKSSGDIDVEIKFLLGKIVESGSLLADVAFSIYIIALCAGGRTSEAHHCMNTMTCFECQPLLTAYNSLIKCLCKEGRVEEANSLIERMEDRGVIPDSATFLVMVNEFCKRGDLASAFDVLNVIDKRGLKPTVAVYDLIIGCLSKKNRLFEAEDMFRRMLEDGIDPDETAFVTMINAYSNNRQVVQACQLFDRMVEYDVRPSLHAYTALINGFIKRNMTEKGCFYLNKMLEHGFMPNHVFYTSLINQFLRKREIEFAFRLVDLMKKSKIEVDLVTYITIVSGVCRNIACFDEKRSLAYKSEKANEMLFHLLCRASLVSNKSIRVSIRSKDEMKFFALENIQKVKESVSVPDLYLYNGMLSGFCWANQLKDADNHLDMMEREGIQPNLVTYTILIDGYMRDGCVDKAIGLFNKMNSYGCALDNKVYSTLIRGLSKAGKLLDAVFLLYSMHKRGLYPCKSSYENLLSALCSHRLCRHALKICQDMLDHDYIPCEFNLKQLIFLFSEENKLQEARILNNVLHGYSKQEKKNNILLVIGKKDKLVLST